MHAGGEVDVVDFREVGDRRGCGERPSLGVGVVGLGLHGCVVVESGAAGLDVREEDFGEAWCDAAAAAGFFEHVCSFWKWLSVWLILVCGNEEGISYHSHHQPSKTQPSPDS